MKLIGIDDIDVQKYIREHKRIDPSAIKKEDRHNLLNTACNLGDTELVRDCINIGEDVTDPWLLENSSYYGHYDIVELLLKNGAYPYGRGNAMYVCRSRGHREVYDLLNQYSRKYKLDKILKK